MSSSVAVVLVDCRNRFLQCPLLFLCDTMAASGQLSSIRLLQLQLSSWRLEWVRSRRSLFLQSSTNRLWASQVLQLCMSARNSGAWHSLTGYYLLPKSPADRWDTFAEPSLLLLPMSMQIINAVEDSSPQSLSSTTEDCLHWSWLQLFNGNHSSLAATFGVRLPRYL